jgi:hypothetical protein
MFDSKLRLSPCIGQSDWFYAPKSGNIRPIWSFVSKFWEDAAGILETAAGAESGDSSDLAIVVDGQNCLRIVYGSGWNVEALQREYQASAAYTITRNSGAVTVEAQSGAERCTLRKQVGAHPLAFLGSGIPRHLVCAVPSRAPLQLQ